MTPLPSTPKSVQIIADQPRSYSVAALTLTGGRKAYEVTLARDCTGRTALEAYAFLPRGLFYVETRGTNLLGLGDGMESTARYLTRGADEPSQLLRRLSA